MKHACVIGGAGFIGKPVVQLLLDSGRQVTVVGRGVQSPFDGRVRYLTSDNAELLESALSKADEVIHLAYSTTPQTSFGDPVKDIIENLTSSVRIFELLLETNVRKVLYVSSGGTVYGHTTEVEIREDHPTNPVSPYGITKLAIEKYGLMFRATRALPIMIVRPGNAFGEGQRPFTGQGFIATAIGAMLQGTPVKVFGDKGVVRDYIHVQDVASAILRVLDVGEIGETYNVGTGVGTSNVEVLDALQPMLSSLGVQSKVEFAPGRSFDVTRNVLSAQKLREAAGWRPTIDFEEGLRRSLAWIRGQQLSGARV